MQNTSIDFIYQTVQKYPDKICVKDDREFLNFRTFFLRAYKLSQYLSHYNKINQPRLVDLGFLTISIFGCFSLLLSNFGCPDIS